jgi:hypothetical protein
VFGLLLVLILVVIIGAGVAVGLSRRSKLQGRGQELEQLAQQQGWHYVDDDVRWVQVTGGIPRAQGLYARQGQARHVVTATIDGWQVTFFHLLAFNRGTRRELTYTTVWAIALPAQLPPMCAIPNSWLKQKITAITGDYRTGDPVFDEMFLSDAKDQNMGNAVLHPEMRQFLVAAGTPFRVDEHGYVITWADGLVIDPNHLIGQGRTLIQIAQRVFAATGLR